MPASEQSQAEGKEHPEIPFERVGNFIRQVSHDVRNNLGSMDLQAAYAAELITDGEAAAEVGKLRGMITSTAKMLQTISRNFQTPKPNLVTLSAAIRSGFIQMRMAKTRPPRISAFCTPLIAVSRGWTRRTR